jgi:nicotinamidase-related amidase
MQRLRALAPLILVALAMACSSSKSAAPTATVAVTSAPTSAPVATPNAQALPSVPAPAALSLDARSTVLAVLDIINPTCSTRPQCMESIPAIAALLKKARDAKVPVIYSTTATTNPIVDQVAPQQGEAVVVPSVADKFYNTNFDDLLKQNKATTILIVGTRSNGAVLYTAFEANAHGYTVAVAVDGISGAMPFENGLTEWQLLNQPGFANIDNKPLTEKAVTLTKGDLVTFK